MINITSLAIGRALLAVLFLIVADTALGIIVALRRNELKVEIDKLPQYLKTGVVPYLGGLVIIAILTAVLPGATAEVRGIFYGSAGLVIAKYSSDLAAKIKCLFEDPKPPDQASA